MQIFSCKFFFDETKKMKSSAFNYLYVLNRFSLDTTGNFSADIAFAVVFLILEVS